MASNSVPPVSGSMSIRPAPTTPFLCLVAVGTLAAGRATAQQFDLADPVPPDPAVTTGTLANGLTYFIHENDEPENRAALRLVVDAGSILEDDDQLGLAHFVEHMAFNGTENFEKQELVSYLESIGMQFGPDLNAYTSFDETVYMLQVPMDDPEVLATAFQILADWAGGVLFDPEEVDAERGVVIEEWRGRLGGTDRIQDEQLPLIFHGSRYADRLPIGDPEILAHAPVERLRSFYEDWYRPGLMAVVAVGDFDGDAIEGLIREHFGGLVGPDNPRPRTEADVPIDHPPLISIGTDPEFPAAQVQVLYKLAESPRGTVAGFRLARVQSLFARMLNERLGELTYQANPPFAVASASVTNLGRGVDASQFNAAVASGGYMRALDAVLTEVARVARHGFTAVELEREKTSLRRSYERRLAEAEDRSSASLANRYTRAFLNGDPYPSVETEVALLDAVLPGITPAETSAFARQWLTDEGRVVLVAGPEGAGLDVPDEDEVTEVFAAVAAKDIEPYVAVDLDVPLLAEIPEGSPVIAEESVNEIGVTIWELANGVRVVLKPTGYSDDEIVFRGTSPGGTSLAPEEILGHVLPITRMPDGDLGAIIARGGVGELGPVALNRHLSDKEASAVPFVGSLTEEIRGSASPQDMETALQLIYQRFTAPRMDEPVFQSLKSQIPVLANLGFLPSMMFLDTLAAYMGQGHPRGPQTLAQQIRDKRAAELDVAMGFYRDRFADASDFTFYFVGAFDLDGIRPLVETYLGGLPSLGRTEDWIDHAVDPPPGVIERTIYKGIAPQSTTAIFFRGDGEYSPEESMVIGAMAAILQTRLRERLREELGGTYSVGVSGGISYRPDEEYSVGIQFGSDPRRTEELGAAVFEEIERLKADGPDAEVVDNIREAQRRSKETSLERNTYWLGQLAAHESARRDIRGIPSYDLIEAWTAEQVRQAANQYLRTDRYMKFVLLPEYMMARARVAAGSPVPVEVIPSGEFVRQGATDLADALRALYPSFNVNTQPISGASTLARPANLRGLAPDHALVLVNGKRRHRTAAIAWHGNGLADGAQGPDFALIPALALREAEILRDGAGPRHGSDAIAGVINFALKNDRSGGTIEYGTGGHLLGDPSAPFERGVFPGDGEMHTVSGNVGLPIGQSGFLNLTGEYGSAMPTDRSMQRNDALALIGSGNTSVREPAQIWGSPEVSDDIKLWANSGYSLLGGIAHLHFHGNYASRQVEGGSHFLNPNTRGGVFGSTGGAGAGALLIGDMLDARDGVVDGSAGCPAVRVEGGLVASDAENQANWRRVLEDPNCFTFRKMFPGGLTPQVGAHLMDGSAVGGLRLNWGSLSLDASGGWGRSNMDFYSYNTVNASLGPDQPCSDKGSSPAVPDQPCIPYFNPGSQDQRETTVNVDLSYAKSETTNIAGGFEWRKEAFEIVEGDGASWTAGLLAVQGFTPGSSGFTGFGPFAAGKWDRTSVAGYGDIEFREADNKWLVDVAGRLENFSDFGLAVSGRVAARLSLTGSFSLRGALGTGFRAPTPGQHNAFNTSTIHEPGITEPVNSGTIPATSHVAEAYGGEPIKPEKSVNASFGAVLGQGGFQLAADYFLIDVSDRLTLSRNFEPTGEDIDRLLDEGITPSPGVIDRFRFFTNDLATRTQGVDVVATYQVETGQGTTSLTSAWNRTTTRVTRHNDRTLSDLRIRILEEGLPGLRGNVSVNHTFPGGTRALVRANYWGGYFDALTPHYESDASNTIDYPGRVLVDAEVARTWMDRWTLTLGARNMLNNLPEEYSGAADGPGNRYGPLTPFGFNGAFFYTRLTYSW
ncbi:MAG: TonB-dependent receptor [Gemmatimonadota bacterium]|nr:TonB-dependent receptor [Gemmatimonadota bacterium]